jgi:hypothetical protein
MTSPSEPVAEPFFEPLPPSPTAADQPPVYVQMPWQPPVNVVPVSVGGTVELARTDDTVVALSSLEAYRTGLAFTVQTWQRPGTELVEDEWAWRNAARLGVLLEDGTKIGAEAHQGPPEDLTSVPETPRIAGLSGMGGGIHASRQHWLYPLPAGERWTFVVEWLARGIPETRTAFDARPVHDAAGASAGPLWELPTPPEGAEYGWFGYAG